ncbi:MAG: NIPSNAP family protein [bacterium]
MIVVRDVFQLKFGKAREAKALWREALEMHKKMGLGSAEVHIDLVGPYYTLVLQSRYRSLNHYENKMEEIMKNSDWENWYQKFIPLVESGRREIFTILE